MRNRGMILTSRIIGATLALLWGWGLLDPGPALSQAGRRQVSEGNRLFSDQKYDAAYNRYRDAQLADPTSPLVQFNIGDALYKKRDFEEALKSYEKVLGAEDPMLAAKAYYNIGNTLYRLGKLPESILAYKKSLELNPNDEDAKYNLEYVRAKLKDQAQKQPQSGQQQQQAEQQQQPSSEQQNQDRQQNQEQQQQAQADQSEDQNKDQERASSEESQQVQQKKLSKEDAERILQALEDQEKDVKRRAPKTSGRRRVLKDW